MDKIKAKKGIYNIYYKLKRDKKLKISNRFSNLLFYFRVLERGKKYITQKEYKKLKNILNKELNSLFFKNKKSKNNYSKKSKK